MHVISPSLFKFVDQTPLTTRLTVPLGDGVSGVLPILSEVNKAIT